MAHRHLDPVQNLVVQFNLNAPKDRALMHPDYWMELMEKMSQPVRVEMIHDDLSVYERNK